MIRGEKNMVTTQPEMIFDIHIEQPEAPKNIKYYDIDSLFGPLTFPEHELFHFPWGVLGLPHLTHFGLSTVSQKKFEHTWLFQPVPSSTHSFIVMPIKTEYFDDTDIDKLCSITGIHTENLAIFCMLSLKKENGKIKGTLNLQAPLCVDGKNRVGCQHIFENPKYALKHLVMDHSLGEA